MRHLILALAAVADVTLGAGGAGAQPPRPQPPPQPPRTVAPPIVYPLPPLMTLPAGGLPPMVPETPRFNTAPPRRGHQFGIPIYTYGFGYGILDTIAPAAPAPTPTPAVATGWLRLSVTPVTTQVFVDGLYVGTVEEIDARRTLMLDAGPHRIDLRARQFRTISVDVRIPASDTLTYRATLEPELPPPPPRADARPPASSSPIYVIPNCYMGNVPPRASRLASGCDIRRLEVLTVGSPGGRRD